MAKSGSKSSGKFTGRAKPMTARASLTKNQKRRYGCGGKLSK